MRIPIIAAAILLIGLTGCGSDSEKPKAAEIKAGDCIAKDIADEDDRGPDLNSVVDCSEPHVYEILDVVDLPKEALKGKTEKERLANRTDLATTESDEDEQTSAEWDAYLKFGQRVCNSALRTMAGYDDIAVNGIEAEKAGVVPVLGGQAQGPWFNVMPARQWLDGKRQIICSVRFTEPVPKDIDEEFPEDLDVKPVSSKNGKPLITTASSPGFPARFRQCTVFDAKEVSSIVGCDKQHYSENLFTFNADAVFDAGFMKGLNQNKPTDAEYEAFDRACRGAFPSVMGKDYDKSKVRSSGFPGFRWGDSYKAIVCDLIAIDSKNTDIGPGAFAWSDAKDVELIDVK